MKSRRRVLTLLGAGTAGLAGCGGNTSSSNPTESNTGLSTSGNSTGGTPEETTEEDQGTPGEEEENGPTQREQNIKSGVPLNGLGAYENQMLEAEPTRRPETTTNQIQTLLEETNNPGQEANQLSQILTDENFTSYMAEFYRQKTDNEDTVVVNENFGLFQNSGPILEIYTVTNNQLQTGPILSFTDYGQTATQKPGDGQTGSLHNMRDNTNGAQFIPQDYDSLISRIEGGRENGGSQEEVRSFRDSVINRWSAGLFGLGENPYIIPHNGESSNVVFNGLYHDGGTEAVVELNNEYRESELFDSDVVVSAEFTGSGWEFHRQEEYEMGDKLPGEQ